MSSGSCIGQFAAQTQGLTASGSWVGTGTYGVNNKLNINCGFYPKFCYVYLGLYGIGRDTIFFRCAYLSTSDKPYAYSTLYDSSSSPSDYYARFVNDSVAYGIRFYSISNADTQMNTKGTTYYWFAIS